MKLLFVLVAVMAVAISKTHSAEADKLDVEAIVNDKNVMKKFTDCFLDKGPCDGIPPTLKSELAEAVKTACEKCTPANKHMLKRYFEEVKKSFPDDIEGLKQKYDPEGKYLEPLRAALANA